MRTAEITDQTLHAFAAEVGSTGPVAVVGRKTRWETGGAVDGSARVIEAPTGIVDYRPEEMTIQVRAGTTVADLHAALAERGQLSALPERGGTVGGAIAVGENAVRTLGRGRLRTSLLQVRYVSADGLLVTGGGPTVKNVSGFDLPRLIVGSLGTLGLTGEVILRTNPIPATTVLLSSPDVDPFAIADTVLRPTVILWDGTTTWVELAGHDDEVAGERTKLDAIGSFAETADLPSLPSERWSLAPAELKALRTNDAATPRFDTGAFVASIGTGTVFADQAQPRREVSAGVLLLHERMKKEFDPTGRLNPGRNPLER